MASKIISITISDEVDDIIRDMKKRDMNLSAHIRSLLKFSSENGFVIPVIAEAVISSPIVDAGMDEEDKQMDGESDADYRERMGF